MTETEMMHVFGGIVGLLLPVVVFLLLALCFERRRVIRAERYLIREVLEHDRTVDRLGAAEARAASLETELETARGAKVAAAGYADSARKLQQPDDGWHRHSHVPASEAPITDECEWMNILQKLSDLFGKAYRG